MASVLDDLQGSFAKFVDDLREIENSGFDKVIYERIYTDLTVLDTKNAAFLQFISILVLAYTILPGMTGHKLLPFEFWTLIIGGLVAAVSAVLALTVSWVRWPQSAKAPELRTPAARAEAMFRVRIFRTLRYRIAWALGLAALFFLALYLLEVVGMTSS